MTDMVNRYWANQETIRHNREMEKLGAIEAGAKVVESEASKNLKAQQAKESEAKQYEIYYASVPEKWASMLKKQAETVGSMANTAVSLYGLFK